MKLLLVFSCILGIAFASNPILSDSFIEEINSKASTWTAKRNFPEDTPREHLQMLASLKGVSRDPNFTLPLKQYKNIPVQADSFDARAVWPQCESIGRIRNQGACGSCWAFGAVESMSDRLCIFSNGGIKFTFSPEELVSCCSQCGYGCQGGYLLDAWQYWVGTGIPSGGDQGSNEGCRPYTAATSGQTPACNQRCVSGYGKNWADDIRKGAVAYSIGHNPDEMKHELSVNGPIEVQFEVFEDFYNYGAGVYRHTSGNSVGWHAVKIIGWGEENGAPFWLVANSWGDSWGDRGFFKIIRGENHCSIESNPVAGNPQV